MISGGPTYPKKRREMVNPHLDSTHWNEVEFRPGDVVVASWAKSGCTWLQQIVGQLIFPNDDEYSIAEKSVWVDFVNTSPREVAARLEKQNHRRLMKTHLPVDALVYAPEAQYIFICRDGRDIAWSLFNHFRNLSEQWYRKMHTLRSRYGELPAGPPTDFRRFFNEWLDRDGFPLYPFFSNVRSWWSLRGLPNLMLLHFNELKNDRLTTTRRLAAFLGIRRSEIDWKRIEDKTSFAYMKSNADRMVAHGSAFTKGAEAFFNAGVNDRWRQYLNEEDEAKYEDKVRRSLPPECASWLETGLIEEGVVATRGGRYEAFGSTELAVGQ